MGRPKKNVTDLHSAVFPPVRCTPQELTEVRRKAAACNLTLSAYVRQMALSGKVVVNDNASAYDPDLIMELNRIGVNLNQMTRRYHQIGEMPRGIDRVWEMLEQVLDKILNQTPGK